MIVLWKFNMGNHLEGRKGLLHGDPMSVISSRVGKDSCMRIQHEWSPRGPVVIPSQGISMCDHLEGQQGFLHKDPTYMVTTWGNFNKIFSAPQSPTNKSTIIKIHIIRLVSSFKTYVPHWQHKGNRMLPTKRNNVTELFLQATKIITRLTKIK